MAAMEESRRKEGKETDFQYGGKPVSDRRMKRRNKKRKTEDFPTGPLVSQLYNDLKVFSNSQIVTSQFHLEYPTPASSRWISTFDT
jgi:hypothetical protein